MNECVDVVKVGFSIREANFWAFSCNCPQLMKSERWWRIYSG